LAYGTVLASKPRFSGTTVIALSSLFFGLMAVVTRLLAGRIPATEIATVRFAVGLVGCGAFFIVRRRRPQLQQWRWLLLRGLFGGVAVLSYFYAIERLGAAPATVLNYTSPVYAAVFAAWFLGETTGPLQRLGLLLATVGASVVTLSTGASGRWAPDVGAAVGVFSAISGGAAMTVIRKLRNDTDAMSVFLGFCTVGMALSAPIAATQWVPLQGAPLYICLAVGVLSIGGQVLFTWGLGHTTATSGSATTQLVPVVAWVLSLTWLEEPATALGVAGALLCVGGVLLGGLRRARRQA
jgi:drug/metabolite transporter (DMT)-like permease